MTYFRDHVYGNHSAVVKPLQHLLEGMNNPTRKLEWTDEATQAFFEIKDLISLQAQLFFANDDDLTYLLTDAYLTSTLNTCLVSKMSLQITIVDWQRIIWRII